MKTIDEYMKLPYTVELIPDADEGGFTVSIPALPGCLSVGETAEEAYRNIEDGKSLSFIWYSFIMKIPSRDGIFH